MHDIIQMEIAVDLGLFLLCYYATEHTFIYNIGSLFTMKGAQQ